MIEFFDLLKNNALVFLSATVFGILLLALLFLVMIQLKSSQRSYYLVEEQRAILSKMRDSYEAQLAKVNMEMTATRDRWVEANHLLLDAQRRTPFSNQPSQLQPTANNFGIDEKSIKVDPKLVFYLTPFGADELHTFKIVKRICEQSGLTCLRGDETNSPNNILSHVVSLIAKARLVIANISTRNANVMYELGIAHSFGKTAILISRTINDTPFDIASNRIIIYQDDEQLEKQLSAMMLNAVSNEALHS